MIRLLEADGVPSIFNRFVLQFLVNHEVSFHEVDSPIRYFSLFPEPARLR